MEAAKWSRELEIDGAVYQAIFIKRPFREGLEVRITLADKTLTVADMGLGESALLERLASMLQSQDATSTP